MCKCMAYWVLIVLKYALTDSYSRSDVLNLWQGFKTFGTQLNRSILMLLLKQCHTFTISSTWSWC